MLFSLFTFGMAYDSPMGRQIAGTDVNWKKALKEGWMSAVRQGRSFGAVGSSYAVCECIIESVSLKGSDNLSRALLNTHHSTEASTI